MLWSSRSLCPLRFLQRHGQIFRSDTRIKCKTCLHTPMYVHFAWSTRVEMIERGGVESELQLCFQCVFCVFFALMLQASSHNGYKWHAQIVADDFFNRKLCTEPGNLKPCRAVPHIKLSQLLKSLASSLQKVAKSFQIRMTLWDLSIFADWPALVRHKTSEVAGSCQDLADSVIWLCL